MNTWFIRHSRHATWWYVVRLHVMLIAFVEEKAIGYARSVWWSLCPQTLGLHLSDCCRWLGGWKNLRRCWFSRLLAARFQWWYIFLTMTGADKNVSFMICYRWVLNYPRVILLALLLSPSVRKAGRERNREPPWQLVSPNYPYHSATPPILHSSCPHSQCRSAFSFRGNPSNPRKDRGPILQLWAILILYFLDSALAWLWRFCLIWTQGLGIVWLVWRAWRSSDHLSKPCLYIIGLAIDLLVFLMIRLLVLLLFWLGSAIGHRPHPPITTSFQYLLRDLGLRLQFWGTPERLSSGAVKCTSDIFLLFMLSSWALRLLL